jgi:hypothetical protein
MADLKRLGVPVSPSSPGNVLHEMLIEAQAGLEAELAETRADHPAKLKADPLDHDGDGEKGGSKPAELPALSGMSKDELGAQAKAEGVDLDKIKGTGADGNVLMGDIKAAIEAKRAK